MPVPSPRNKILPARGNYADLASNAASLLDGEICYAIDQDQYYQNEGGVLVSVGATKAQGILADSAVQPGDNVSDLVNDAGYITSAGAPVQSVAGKTGVVTLVKADITDFSDADYATAAQGALADSATQPGDNVSTLVNDAGYITSAQAPVQSVAGKTGVVTLVKGDVGLGNVDNTSDLDKPISTATQTALNLKADLVGGVIPNSQLPSLAISEYLGSVASEAAMLALVGQRGDWAIRTDTGSTWVITTDGGSLLSDWTELATPADAVTSVNGYTGTVVLGKADVGLGNVDNTSDLNKPVSTATQTALNLKANLASPALTGTPTAPTATPGTNTTQLATTAFVGAAVTAAAVPPASETVQGKVELATAAETTAGSDNTRAVHPAGLKVELDKKANLASPALTGTPTAPTATAGTNTTQLATTAFVTTAVANKTTNFNDLTNKTAGTGNYTTTGNFTSAAVIPTGATVPTNGMYLLSTNQVGFATNSAFKFGVDSLDGNPLFENNYPTIRPTLDLRFAATKKLDPKITFTRASSGTYTDQFGVLQTAVDDEPRFDHNPSTGESLGLLVEEARTNLLWPSQFTTFATTAANNIWYETVAELDTTANAGIAPDGTTTAALLSTNTSTSFRTVFNRTGSIATSALAYSVFCKAISTDSLVRLLIAGEVGVTNSIRADFTLSGNGSVSAVTTTGTAVSTSTPTIQNVGNGWYRCTIYPTFTSPSNITCLIYPGTASAQTTASQTLVWGAQVEAGAFPTSYIKTEAATATRAADVASITGTNFSSLYNPGEGTVFFESKSAQGTAATPWSLFGINTFNRISANYTTLNRMQSFTRLDSVFEALLSTNSDTAPLNTFGKGATGYKVNDFGFSWNGAAVLTDNSTGLPTALQFDIGNNGGLASNFLNGHLKRLTYFPKRLPDATLQSITQ